MVVLIFQYKSIDAKSFYKMTLSILVSVIMLSVIMVALISQYKSIDAKSFSNDTKHFDMEHYAQV